jgi:hypothetical protein
VPSQVRPVLFVDVLHATPQPPQSVVVVVGVSQPLVSGAVALQFANPALHDVYEHAPEPHEAPLLLVVSHTLPQPPQARMLPVAVSQPFVSAPLMSQFAYPAEQLVYEHFPALHEAPTLLLVSQALPHAPQLLAVLSVLSQPLVFAPEVSQSPKPVLHEYAQTPAVQVALLAFVTSQRLPQAPQLSVVVVAVSQPFASVPLVSQLAKPGLHAEYAHEPALHDAPRLFVVSHELPHAPQFVAVFSGASQPLVFAPLLSQSPKPALHV